VDQIQILERRAKLRYTKRGSKIHNLGAKQHRGRGRGIEIRGNTVKSKYTNGFDNSWL